MEASRVSDFSIERILSPQLGQKPAVSAKALAPSGFLHSVPRGFGYDAGEMRAAVPLPLPLTVSGCLQHGGMSFGDTFYAYGTTIHHADFRSCYPNSGVYVRFSQEAAADPQSLGGCHGYQQAGMPTQPQPRQKARMRTVFTDSQSKQLEALFEITDYPAVEARAEVARSAGLSEETVRVWFKNRRARRKRQCSGSKVKPPSPPHCAGTDNKVFSSFL